MTDEKTILEEFTGTLDILNEETAFFRFASKLNGDSFTGEFAASIFTEKKIEEGQQFILRTVKYKNNVIGFEIEPIPLKELTDDDYARIKNKLAFLDNGGF